MASNFGAACRELGYESHYFSMIDGKVDDACIDYFHEINIFEKEAIANICKEISIDGVVATTELSVSTTAYVADKLGLLGNPIEVANLITNKYRNRECIKNVSLLLSPRYVMAKTIEDIKKSNIPYPMIVKPAFLGGKRGITVVYNESQLLDAFNYACLSFKDKTGPLLIVEQFLEGGLECSVESISYKGEHTVIQITQKDSSGAPHCVELGHHQPADISPLLWDKVVKSVSDGLTAIGVTNGPCHTEIKIIDDKIYLIEFNARPGGDHIWELLVKLSTGFDIMKAIVQAAGGELPSIDVKSFKQCYSGLYYVVKQTEALKLIFDNCLNYDWCVEKHFVTDELSELTHNNLRGTNYFIYRSELGNPVIPLLQ